MKYLISLLLLITFAVPQSHAQATDALDEVNAQRAARGLKPYIRDENLTQGAMAAAKFRADRLMFGHTASDHAHLPARTFERFRLTNIAAGCAAYPKSYGFMACAVYDNYTYAGAATVTGRDGKRYCQLFVADGPAASTHGSMFTRTTTTVRQSSSPGQFRQSVRITSRRR